MAKMELTCSYACYDEGMVTVLNDGFTDSPRGAIIVREVLRRARDRKNDNRDMYREIAGLLVGQVAQRMQTQSPSSADHIVCAEHLKEMFR